MFLYPALTLGFLFVGVPLLVHLINMLRHRRQPWAAMDFLLASYRKQKKWIRLRQLLLLLSRLAVAALLIAMLAGWTGGGKLLGALGGRTTHHLILLDDSASMGDRSSAPGGEVDVTAYQRALGAIADLTRRLATEDGNHQLTVIRSSRAALASRAGEATGDAIADLSSQTVTSDGRLINRLMSTAASSIHTDMTSAIDMASDLIRATPADAQYVYIASDFRARDWANPERMAEAMRRFAGEVNEVRMIDCAAKPLPNAAVTELSPSPDVWVAGVPVVISAKVRNYSDTALQNISLSARVIRYPDSIAVTDPTRQISGEVESLPAMLIESLEPGEEVMKSFQVFVAEPGTHAIEVSLPEDALSIDNSRVCTLPLSDVEKVLVIDGDAQARGAYHIASVLNPGSQVRIGAVPDVQPPSFLRGASYETLAPYRAIYLVNLADVGENAADALHQYVQRGGGLAWFLGAEVNFRSYNDVLLRSGRQLLPAPLAPAEPLVATDSPAPDVVFGETSPLMQPLRSVGDAAFSLVGLAQSWTLDTSATDQDRFEGATLSEEVTPEGESPRVVEALRRRDGLPFVTLHQSGRGSVVTVLSGLDGAWTNWPGDPTFVVFMLQANATLWSGAAPLTVRMVDEKLERVLPGDQYLPEVTYVPATSEPPRIPIDLVAEALNSNQTAMEPVLNVALNPLEMVLGSETNIDELIRPGLGEWGLTRVDGRGEVVPVASVIQNGEGDLKRTSAAEVQQALLPMEVRFVSSSAWSEENQAAGTSTLTLALLGLLATMLAGEQALAYWASYHVTPAKGK